MHMVWPFGPCRMRREVDKAYMAKAVHYRIERKQDTQQRKGEQDPVCSQITWLEAPGWRSLA